MLKAASELQPLLDFIFTTVSQDSEITRLVGHQAMPNLCQLASAAGSLSASVSLCGRVWVSQAYHSPQVSTFLGESENGIKAENEYN